MEANVMEDRRSFSRFSILLRARYIVEGCRKDRGECTIINTNHKGIGIRFHTREKIKEGSTIHLEIFVSENLKPISVKGVLKWNKKRENGYSAGVDGGIECNELLDEMHSLQRQTKVICPTI